MTLQTSGSISMQQVRAELEYAASGLPAIAGSNNLNSHVVRSLSGQVTGTVSLRAMLGRTAFMRGVLTFGAVTYSTRTYNQSNYLGLGLFNGVLAYIRSGSTGAPNNDMYVLFDTAYPAPTWDGQLYVKNMSSGQASSPLSKQDSYSWVIVGGAVMPYYTKDVPNPQADMCIRAV